MSAPLIISRARLEAHLNSVEAILRAVVDDSVDARVSTEWAQIPVVSGLVGEGTELIARNRGLPAPVAPLKHVSDGLWAWLGYREEWDVEPSAGATQRLSFRSAGLTIHLGWKGDAIKPQLFRAEWAGYARWAGSGFAFQAKGAGHPHWQFDALESLLAAGTAEAAEVYLAVLKEETQSEEVKEFAPGLRPAEIREVIQTKEISRIHFPSAAAWWMSSPQDRHAHSPLSGKQVEDWLSRSMEYLMTELDRL